MKYLGKRESLFSTENRNPISLLPARILVGVLTAILGSSLVPVRSNLVLFSLLRLRLPSSHFPSVFPTKSLYIFCSPAYALHPNPPRLP